MPVRSLSSSVLKWPDAQLVDQAIRVWAFTLGKSHSQILKIGYIGSYARGDWGVGSDVDILILVSHSEQPFEQRSSEWDTGALPIPADVIVYTIEEWQRLPKEGRFYKTVSREVRWVFERIENETGSIGTPSSGGS